MNRLEAPEVSDDEASFGFQLLMLESDGADPWELTVAYLINESEIVAKTVMFGRIGYKHRCWGIMRFKDWPGLDTPPEQTTSRWHPVGNGIYDDPGEAAQSSQYHQTETTLAPVEKRAFKFELYDPARHGP